MEADADSAHSYAYSNAYSNPDAYTYTHPNTYADPAANRDAAAIAGIR